MLENNESVLQAIFYGKYIPYENIAPKENVEYVTINSKINNEKELFKNTLSKDDYIRLEIMESLYSKSSKIEVETAYMVGFRFAVKIMAEVYVGKDNIPNINELFNIKK